MIVFFVYLCLYIEFFLVDGLVWVKFLVKVVVGLGMLVVVVIDQSNMCLLVKFYKIVMGVGIKLICGVDIWFVSCEEDGLFSCLSLLVMNVKGYCNFIELIFCGWSEGQCNGEIIIECDWVKEVVEGLIVLFVVKEGEIGYVLFDGEEVKVEVLLCEWMEVFFECFYVEV